MIGATRGYATAAEVIRRAAGLRTSRRGDAKQVNVRYGRQSLEQIGMAGITPNILEIEGYGVEAGRPLQDWDEEHSRFVAFIGADVAEKLFLGVDPLGKVMQIDDHAYTVIGIAEKKGSVFGFSRDNFAKVPISTFPENLRHPTDCEPIDQGAFGQMQDVRPIATGDANPGIIWTITRRTTSV